MRVHNLKILNDFADAVAMGDKTFEIRENDRGYQKGDYIKFLAIEKTVHRIIIVSMINYISLPL